MQREFRLIQMTRDVLDAIRVRAAEVRHGGRGGCSHRSS
jgi:hypothetical protein